MATFAEDNTKILNSKRRQYNRSTQNTAQYGEFYDNTASVSLKNEEQFRTTEDIIHDTFERIRTAKKKRDAKFARENNKKVREALAEGPKKAVYKYDEYKTNERNIPFGLLAISLALTLVAVFLLLNYSQISKYNTKINNLKTDISEYREEAKQLSIILDKNCDFEDIEAYARENGMIGSEQIESHYISMADSFKIENTDEKENDDYIISTVMSGFVKLFSEVIAKE